MIDSKALETLRERVHELYKGRNRDVPFHGLHHLEFVARKSVTFAAELGADNGLTVAAAYTHDLNYLVDVKTGAESGSDARRYLLEDIGLSEPIARRVDKIVLEAETAVRSSTISIEGQALSDADTLFKALPITPVILAPLYMRETGLTLRELAKKIVSEQVPLRDNEIYFYSPSARAKYSSWGNINLDLWTNILSSLDDPDVESVLSLMGIPN
jgi:uncharacterized protein